jgi:hypothetical protein
VGVFPLLDRASRDCWRIQQLTRQALDHRILVALARRGDQPANGECLAALGAHLDRHLIGGTTDAARADFDVRRDIVQRLMEHGTGSCLGPLLNLVQRTIDDCSATDFFPSSMTAFMNLVITRSPNFGSGFDLTLFCGFV